MDQPTPDAHAGANTAIDRRFLLGGLTGAAGVAALASIGRAGPLNPPAGPVAPTAGPEPRTPISAATTPGDATNLYLITQPGSYYLTGNINGVAGKRGIGIAVSGVSIDLNGFTMDGVAGSLMGIGAAASNLTALTVANGTIRAWSVGVDFSTPDACRVQNIVATANRSTGIRVSSESAVVACTAHANGFFGILAEYHSLIEGCTATGNTDDGITITSGRIHGCIAGDNGGSGIAASQTSTITDCVSFANARRGFSFFQCCAITGCVARENGTDGISAGSLCHIRGNTLAGNGTDAAGGANIRLSGSDSRVEANTCSGADRGIHVTGSGNFIAANTVSSASVANWDVAANNKCYVVAGANAAAFTGNSGGESPGSTSPWANFTI
ncbi:MAG TPA: right-handed parallel beta-helix repeat-containing protein [Phycisphaerales bacterium]|nr:right-handed parallel beta-helix repeat-containing protein [Phycisphaerales bacterium]